MDNEKEHSLLDAIKAGDINSVEELLDNDADIHFEDDIPLFTAIKRKDLEMVRLLLNRGADINSNSNGVLPTAVATNNVAIVQLLLEYNFDELVLDSLIGLVITYPALDPLILNALIVAGGPDIIDDDFLNLAIEYNNTNAVRILINHGVDKSILLKTLRNIKDENLILAYSKILHDNGVDPDVIVSHVDNTTLLNMNVSTKTQCSGITKVCSRCKKRTKQGSEYCNIHDKE